MVSILLAFEGFASVFTEAMLAAPQFYRNYMNKSTEGMRFVWIYFKTTQYELVNTGRTTELRTWESVKNPVQAGLGSIPVVTLTQIKVITLFLA